MKKCILNVKLKNLTETVNLLLLSSNDSIGNIHILRKQTRELLSLVDDSDPFYPKLKKIIKLSNTIRDMDVFFSTYVESLKPSYKKALDMNLIIENSNKTRNKLFQQLYLYIENLKIPENIKSKNIVHPLDFPKIQNNIALIFEQKTLHKYRIQIKHTLYALKNLKKQKRKQLKTLTTLKDLLGKINDNFNGLSRLKKLHVTDAKLLDKIEKYTIERNMKYFKKVQKLSKLL